MLEVYPIGRAVYPASFDANKVNAAIDRLAALPGTLRAAVEGCTDLDHPVRDDIWSIRALVQHLADAHMVAFIRTKLALTEDSPAVPSYDPVAWSKLGDAPQDIEPSLELLTGLHARWVELMRPLTPTEWERTWRSIGSDELRPTWRLPLTYGWHGDHHVAQIRHAREHYRV